MPPNPTLLAHPATRKLAEEMARELFPLLSEPVRHLADSLRLLLSDLERPASRDAWVRWGIENDESWSSPESAEAFWLDLRDNPAALLAAILEATT